MESQELLKEAEKLVNLNLNYVQRPDLQRDKQNQVEWMNADENPAGLLLLLLLLLFVIVRVDVSIHGLINGLCRSLIRAIVSSNKFDTRP